MLVAACPPSAAIQALAGRDAGIYEYLIFCQYQGSRNQYHDALSNDFVMLQTYRFEGELDRKRKG